MMQTSKLFVTGPFRSGSTYLAALLNSQPHVGCFEDYPWRHFKHVYASMEEFNCWTSRLEAQFLNLGIQPPNTRDSSGYADSVEIFISHLKQLFDIRLISFKSCMHGLSEIKKRVDDGFKVVLLKRSTEKIIKSWVNRIDPSLVNSAITLRNYYRSIDYYDINSSDIFIFDFDDFLRDKKKWLSRLSDFLGFDIVETNALSHSYSRGKGSFFINSSFSGAPDSSSESLRSSLRVKYDPDEIRRVASLVDNNRRIDFSSEVIRNLVGYLRTVKNRSSGRQFGSVDW